MDQSRAWSQVVAPPTKPHSVAILCFIPDFGHLQPLLKIADALIGQGFSVKCYVAGECSHLLSRIDAGSFALQDTSTMIRTARMERIFARGLFLHSVCLQDYYLAVYPQVGNSVLQSVDDLKRELQEQNPDIILCDPLWFLDIYTRIASSLRIPLIVNSLDGSLAYCQRAHVQIYGPSAMAPFRQSVVEILMAISKEVCGAVTRARRISDWLTTRAVRRATARAFAVAFPVDPGAAVEPEWIVMGTAMLEREHLGGLISTATATRREFPPLRFRARAALPTSLTAWLFTDPERPIVYVSLGSAVAIDRPFAIALYEGLRRVSARVLWSLPASQQHFLSHLTPAANIRIESFVPQAEILDLPAVACFVGQAGAQSVLEAFFGATPMVCIPFFADQAYNSAIVDLLGVGLRVCRSNMTAASVTTAVAQVLGCRSYADRANALRDRLGQTDGGLVIAKFFDELVSRSVNRRFQSPAP